MSDPVQVHVGARPKTHISTGVLIPPPRPLPPMSPMTYMTPSRVLSSIPNGNEGDDVDRIETLRRKYRKALNPTPIEGIDVRDSEEVLPPQLEFLIKVILNCHLHYMMLWIQVKSHKNSYQNKER